MKRILLAEDEEHLARLIMFKLQKEGFEVAWAPNGAAAWERLQKGELQVDLLILDVMMPVMGGLEVLKLVKGNEATRSIPVLVLTAKGFHSDMTAASELGAEQFMRKPFDPATLISVVRKMVGV